MQQKIRYALAHTHTHTLYKCTVLVSFLVNWSSAFFIFREFVLVEFFQWLFVIFFSLFSKRDNNLTKKKVTVRLVLKVVLLSRAINNREMIRNHEFLNVLFTFLHLKIETMWSMWQLVFDLLFKIQISKTKMHKNIFQPTWRTSTVCLIQMRILLCTRLS